MDLKEKTNQEIFIKNLFSILSADRGSRIFWKPSLLCVVRELGLQRDTIQVWFEDWKKKPGEIRLFDEGNGSKNGNRDLLFYSCSALLADDAVPVEMIECLGSLASRCEIPVSIVHSILSNRINFMEEKSFIKRANKIILSFTGQPGQPKTPNVNARLKQVSTGHFYVANQVSHEGLDELQRLLLAYRLGSHAAIDGPPGVGKTHSVMEIAKILGLNLYTKTCSSRTTESHIISYPVLGVREGASVTTHVNGPLVCAMLEPGIFYGDEFNLLKEDVQKRMNSAFDERRYIDRNDGVQIMARPGFWGIISYNPTQNLTARDLEDSVADRFIHLHYGRWPSAFKAYVAHRKARADIRGGEVNETDFNISLSWRGISRDGGFFVGKSGDGHIKWYDFFTGKLSENEPDYTYQVNDTESIIRGLGGLDGTKVNIMSELERNALPEIAFARVLSQFTDTLQSLSATGRSPMLKKLGLGDTIEEEDLELLSLHGSSARIEVAALKHYHYLLEKGFNRYLAQSYAVRLVIDQVCYGQYREKKLRDHTAYGLVQIVARSMRLLIDLSRYNTNLTPPPGKNK